MKKYECKKDALHLNGEIAFQKGKQYEYIKTMGNVVFMKSEDGSHQPITKEYFKETFKSRVARRW